LLEVSLTGGRELEDPKVMALLLALRFELASVRALLARRGLASVDAQGELAAMRNEVLDVLLDVPSSALNGADALLFAAQVETAWSSMHRLASTLSETDQAR
jgi:hypothetical protein